MQTIDLAAGPDGVYRPTGRTRTHRANAGGRGGGGNNSYTGSNAAGAAENDGGSFWGTMSFYNKTVATKLIKVMLIALIAIGIMVIINVKADPWWNLWIFLLTTILYTAIVLSPIPIVTSALLGTFYAWLANSKVSQRDLSQGALAGLKTLLDPILFGGLTVIQVVTGFLATWPLRENPAVFLLLLCGAMVIAVVFKRFRLGGEKWFAWGVVIYTATILLYALWTTIPSQAKTDYIPFYNSSEGSEKANEGGHAVARSGETIAPVGGWSDWVPAPKHLCVFWWGTEPNGDRFDAEYKDGVILVAYSGGTPKGAGVRFRSKTGEPEKVFHDSVLKSGGKCPDEQ